MLRSRKKYVEVPCEQWEQLRYYDLKDYEAARDEYEGTEYDVYKNDKYHNVFDFMLQQGENFDYISWFGCYSSYIDSELVLDALSSEKYKNYKLNYMFNADGIYDFAYNGHKKMVNELVGNGKFDDDNVEYVQVAFGYHSARSWRVGLYDSLQRFFKRVK